MRKPFLLAGAGEGRPAAESPAEKAEFEALQSRALRRQTRRLRRALALSIVVLAAGVLAVLCAPKPAVQTVSAAQAFPPIRAGKYKKSRCNHPHTFRAGNRACRRLSRLRFLLFSENAAEEDLDADADENHTAQH